MVWEVGNIFKLFECIYNLIFSHKKQPPCIVCLRLSISHAIQNWTQIQTDTLSYPVNTEVINASHRIQPVINNITKHSNKF